MTRSDIDWNRLPMDWVGNWSGRRAALTPAREALVDVVGGRRWRYAELDAWACRLGNWLTDTLGIAPGERVALIARNVPEAVAVYLACGKLGVVLVPLSHRLTAGDIAELTERSGARAVLLDPALGEAPLAGLSAGTAVVPMDAEWEARVGGASVAECNRPLALEDPFLYVHTGGSTGTPKLCEISHRQMVWNSVELIASSVDGLGARRELVLFPLYHIGGWNTVTPVFHAGGCVVLLPAFDPAAVLAAIAAESVNHFGAVETMLHALSAHETFAQSDLSSLAAITTAGAPCSDAAMAPFRARGVAVGQSYGQTEAGPSNFIHLGREDDPGALERFSQSVGTSFLHCDYRIVGESGCALPAGEVGELWLRSPHAFEGYVGDPERSRQVLDADGWVHTGDLARADEGGRVYIVGRVDNMFVSGGENIAPEEIERVLLAHPRIAQVAVYASPDAHWGTVPAAVVVASAGASAPDAEALDAWLEGRLARFKRPRRYHVVDELPLTGAGKIDREALRRRHGGAAPGFSGAKET
ncbi:class I adenylate-forming enzyme family protein [Arhodomonas sp. AD133]|uniref:class I adenylate-forming enzyme family protein n=1 Tax=Arhodomonas sp. AD133 TaxID=3415009 RepID=UPI003EBF39D4